MSDAFCSDHSGHIFTANSDCTVTSAVWMYTAATNAWSQLPSLPFAHGCNAACTVTKDGWLYFGEGDNNNLARLKL